MNKQMYHIAFSGELLTGFTLEQAKQNLSRIFKISLAKAEALFSGRKHILKKNINLPTAKKYREALKKQGIGVVIEESGVVGRPSVQPIHSSLPNAAELGAAAARLSRSQQRQVGASKAAADCASKPVSMAISTAKNLSPLLKSAATPNREIPPLDIVANDVTDKRIFPANKPVFTPSGPSKTKPKSKPPQNTDTASRKTSALEELQRLLEKSRTHKPAGNTATPILDKQKPSAGKNTLLKGVPSPTVKREAVAKKNPMLTNPLLKGIKPAANKLSSSPIPLTPPLPQKTAQQKAAPMAKKLESKPADIDQTIQPPRITPAPLPSTPKKSAASDGRVQEQEHVKPKVEQEQTKVEHRSTSELVNKPFEQPILLSCIICGQTQHIAQHCLNCNSVFEVVSESTLDGISSELEKLLGHEGYENTPLEKALWPGVTVLLFLYTLIFNFNLPLITFWVSDDTFDNLIATELKHACNKDSSCLTAIKEQLNNCIKRSGIYEFKPQGDKRVQLDGYLDSISSCIVDRDKKPFFGVGTKTPFKNLQ